MQMLRIFFMLALALFALAPNQPAAAQGRDRDQDRGRDRDDDRGRDDDEARDRSGGRDGWKLLGARRVSFRLEKEVLDVGRAAGRIDNIRLRARGNDIFVDEVRVVFDRGDAQDIDVGERVAEGSDTRPVALGRGGRFIERIEILARERPSLRRRGVIEVYGEGARGDDRPGPEGYELIGSRAVGFSLDRDIIDVERRGVYGKIRLRARGDDIFVREFRAIYANGGDDDFRVGSTLREGEFTQAVELDRGGGPLRQVEVMARARPGVRRRAVIEVYGEPRRGRPEARWEELGCQKVGFLVDRDVIRVGREEGRFKALKLTVEDNDVFLRDMRLVFANGEVDDYNVSAEIRRGQETRPISLRAGRRGRTLDRIIFVYTAKPSLRGFARVCVHGQE